MKKNFFSKDCDYFFYCCCEVQLVLCGSLKAEDLLSINEKHYGHYFVDY